MTVSAFTIYANPGEAGVAYIYVYSSREIMEHIRQAVTNDGLRRGMGRSNDDTFAVLVPLAAMRWSAAEDNHGLGAALALRRAR